MPKRSWRSWSGLAFPYAENGLGIKSMVDICKSFSCKLWWKFHTTSGIWATYCHSIGLERSFVKGRVGAVDILMKSNTRVLLHDGRSSFLFSNWTGLGELQYLALSDFSSLEPFCVRDFFQDGGWDFDRFRHLFPSEVLE